MGMGLKFEQDRHSDDGICAVGRWDLCSGTMGFSQNFGWEMGIGSPLQGPHIKLVDSITVLKPNINMGLCSLAATQQY